MAGTKGKSGGPRPNAGGKRPGAGRKPSAPSPEAPAAALPADYTAETYLRAVVEGREPADAHRIAAARSLLRFEAPVRRVPMRAPSAEDLAKRNEIADDTARKSDFAERAAAIRAKHGRK